MTTEMIVLIRMECAKAFWGRPEKSQEFNAGRRDVGERVLALLPTSIECAKAALDWQDDCECGHGRWQHRPKCGAWPVDTPCECVEFRWVGTTLKESHGFTSKNKRTLTKRSN